MAGTGRRIAVGLGAAWLAWHFFGPEVPPRHQGPQRRPSRLTGRTVVIGRHEFFVREAGPEDAPVVVLVHGWVYASVGTWHHVIGPLAEQFRVIAVDLRNHGKSDRIRGRFEIEDACDETAAVLDTLDVSRATVVGYSMGGMVAQALAVRHPRLVGRLVLAGTAAFPVPERRGLARAVFALGRAIGFYSPVFGARLSYWYLLRTGAVAREHAAWLWETLADRDVDLYFQSAGAIWRFDARPWAGGIDVPTLVIVPTRDQLVPPPAQYELASLIPGAEIVELVGAKHEAVLTHADDITKEIVRFAS